MFIMSTIGAVFKDVAQDRYGKRMVASMPRSFFLFLCVGILVSWKMKGQSGQWELLLHLADAGHGT